MTFKIIRVLGDAVGHVMFHPVPYEFGRIERWSIPGKEVGMNTRMTFKESLDRPGLVHPASVPKKDEPSLQVPQEVPQESQYLRMPDVLQGMKADIQSNSPLTGRYTDRRDSRDLRPSSCDLKNGRFSNRRPGLSDSWDKAKPALVEEDQGNFKSFGLFLYAAMNGVSILLFPFHPALWLWSRVSDGSTAILAGSSKHGPDDKSLRNVYQLLWPLSPASTGQWSNRFSVGLPQAFVPEPASGARLVSQVCPARVSISKHLLPFSYVNHPSNTPNLTSNRVSQLSGADSFRYPRALKPAAFAFQALFGFHGVAWNQFTIFLLLMRESIVYTVGLFDYFDDSVARTLLSRIYSAIDSCGLIIVGNMDPSNASRFYMEYVMDWYLYYRTMEQMLALTTNLMLLNFH